MGRRLDPSVRVEPRVRGYYVQAIILILIVTVGLLVVWFWWIVIGFVRGMTGW